MESLDEDCNRWQWSVETCQEQFGQMGLGWLGLSLSLSLSLLLFVAIGKRFSCIFVSSCLIISTKWAIPGLFSNYFRSFQRSTQFLQQINVSNDPSSMQHWDLNSQILAHEHPPITTKPFSNSLPLVPTFS